MNGSERNTMKVNDLVEALQTAGELYKKKHKKEMEIFDLEFESDDHPGCITIDAVSSVTYDDEFGGSRTGKGKKEKVIIRFEVDDGKIDDRSVEMEDDV